MGMPGLEKRLSRHAQYYSQIGFVHEFRPLNEGQMRQLLEQHWTPPGVALSAADTLGRSLWPRTSESRAITSGKRGRTHLIPKVTTGRAARARSEAAGRNYDLLITNVAPEAGDANGARSAVCTE